MVLMTHNTDIADGWEREGEDTEYFHRFSIDAYAVGINVLMYAMTPERVSPVPVPRFRSLAFRYRSSACCSSSSI